MRRFISDTAIVADARPRPPISPLPSARPATARPPAAVPRSARRPRQRKRDPAHPAADGVSEHFARGAAGERDRDRRIVAVRLRLLVNNGYALFFGSVGVAQEAKPTCDNSSVTIAFGRQHLAQDVQIRHLRLNLLDLLLRRRGGFADRGAAAGGLAVAGLAARRRADRRCRPWRRDDSGVRRKRRISDGIDIDADGFQAVGPERPARHGRQFQPRADADHQIGRAARAGRPPPWSVRVRARWRRCRGRCGRPRPAHRSSRRVRGFPRAHGSRRCRRRSSAVLLPVISAAAALMRSGSGCGAGKGSNSLAAPTSARCVNTSHGISSDTGPRRPDSISWNARETIAGAASGYSMRSAHLTKVRSVASWSGISCRWPRPLPRNCRRHLAGQAQHRLVAAERGEQRRAGVEHAGAGHHAEHAGLAGSSAHSQRPCSRRPARAARRSPSTAPDGRRRTGRRSARRAGRTRYRRHARRGH